MNAWGWAAAIFVLVLLAPILIVGAVTIGWEAARTWWKLVRTLRYLFFGGKR